MHPYLLFHSLAEIAAATISFGTFLFAWNTRRHQNAFLLALGTSGLFVGAIETLHGLAFPGMAVFPGFDQNLSLQLWLCARILQAAAAVLGLGLLLLERRASAWWLLGGFALASLALSGAVFSGLAPPAVTTPAGLTTVKVAVEWALAAAFLGSVPLLHRARHHFAPGVFRLLVAQAVAMAACEVCFTLYLRPYEENLLGHLFLLAGGVLQYLAVLRAGLTDPGQTLFLDLTRARDRLERAQTAARVGTFEWDSATPGQLSIAGMETVYGLAPGEMAGTPQGWRARVHPDDLPRVDRHLEEVLAGRTAYDVEHRVLWPDGSVHWVAARGRLERDPQGRPLRLSGVNMEITDRKRADAALRESEEQYRLLFVGNPTPMLVFDEETLRILAVNDRAVRAYGWTRDEFLALSVLDIRPPRERQAAREIIGRNRQAREASIGVVRHRRKDGAEMDVEVTASSIRWGGREARLVALSDVTERRLAGERLQSTLAALQQANGQLAEADHRKNEFLAMLSHELRNPLAPILSSLRLLERAAPGGEQARRAHQVIDRQVGQLTRLIDDLLDVMRISRGKIRLQRESMELNEVVRGTAEDHLELFRRGGVELEVSIADRPLRAEADRTRVAQVVANLLQNAAKFTPRGGKTRLTLRAEGAAAVIEVEDDGAGIEPQLLGRLFEPFVQADKTLDRSRGGLGLGLALVKGLLELHGGTVQAFSPGPGLGSRFTVRFPVVDQAGPHLAVVSALPGASAPRHVLIVEDNTDAAESLKELLELSGHRVELAHTGPEGIRRARAARPEVVLCDLGLPEIDGYGVARALRADPDLGAVLLVALSGYALYEDVERARQAGFDHHLAKPPDLDALERLLQEAHGGKAVG